MGKKPPETPAVAPTPLFTVEAKQYVSLVFPKTVYTGYGSGPHDFIKSLSPDEARSLSVALKQASAELD